jgi:hypothetical protein
MKIVMVGFVGLLLGAIVGGIIGVGTGMISTSVFISARSQAIRECWCFTPSCRLGLFSAR